MNSCMVCKDGFGAVIVEYHLNWEDIVAGGQGLFRKGFGMKTCVYRSCQGILWHAGAWKPRRSVAGCILWHAGAWKPRRSMAVCILWHAGAWKPRCSVAGCILGYAIAWDSTI